MLFALTGDDALRCLKAAVVIVATLFILGRVTGFFLFRDN